MCYVSSMLAWMEYYPISWIPVSHPLITSEGPQLKYGGMTHIGGCKGEGLPVPGKTLMCSYL